MGLIRGVLATTRGRVLLVAVLVVGIAGQQLVSRATAAPPKAELRTVPVSVGSVTQTVAVSGSVNPSASYRLSFRTAGKLTDVLVAVGEQVTKDQPVARIDTSDLRTALAAAQNTLDIAATRYEQIVAGADPRDVADARRALDKSTTNYANAKSTVQANVLALRVDVQTLPDQLITLRDQLVKVQAALQKVAQPFATPIPPTGTEPPGPTPEPTANTSKADARTAVGHMNQAQSYRDAADTSLRDNLTITLNEYLASYTNLQTGIAAFDAAAANGSDTAAANSFFQTAYTTYGTSATKSSSSFDALSGYISSITSSLTSANSAVQTGGSRGELNLDQARLEMTKAAAMLQSLSQQIAADKTRITQTGTALATVSDSVSGGYLASQSSYQRVLATPKPTDILSAQSSVESAKVAVQNAQLNLEGATLKAPSNGTIATIVNQVGENVTTASVMTMANTTSLTLRGTVGEADVAKLRVGQVATITVDAVGATATSRMTGRVNSIDPVATIQSGVPVYGVDTIVDIPAPGVRPGMSGTANIIIASHQGVLTVPNLAIRSQGTRRYVQVLRNGEAVDADVTFGLSNETATEVMSGLEATDIVVLPQPRAAASGQARPQGVPGGGGIPFR